MLNGLDAAPRMVPSRLRETLKLEHKVLAHSFQQSGTRQLADVGGAGLSLLFRPGTRPGAQDIARLIESSHAAGLLARVSHMPAPEEGWLELLASGLTFDMRGLAPAAPVPITTPGYMYGFEGEDGMDGLCEAVELLPSGHIAAGGTLQPVLRTLMGLAADLALNLPVAGVAWAPAQTLMEPRYFSRMVLGWLSGGAFPALGLTTLVRGADGSIASQGLAHFTGQEMQMEGRAGESPADTVKLAIRVVDHLVRQGRIAEPLRIGTGPGALLAEPSQVGNLVLVWREAL
ncbi:MULTISPECIES: hypothetical protein [unclassified Novosphingobium]|uniref:hypothetical protein n=1 Tax=unclassified Novosphingobium TaxID=2644732 RepID=UPI001F1DB03B|nr:MULTISPECIES: hypothetical protein [unclassified Novosphingobium]